MKNPKIKSLDFFCDRDRVRTCNPQSRNLIFYPVELRSHYLKRKENRTKRKD